MNYGYARVSSTEQNADRQLIAMREYGINTECIYLDKQSGKDFNRPAYQKLIRKVKPGDLIVFTSIDRMGRNRQEILEQWQLLTKKKNVDIQVLDMPLLNTQFGKDLLGNFVADLVLQLLSFVAETERENIHKRQAEGIAAARARGVKFGRPARQIPEGFYQAVRDWNDGKITCTEGARRCGLPISTFRYKAGRMNQ